MPGSRPVILFAEVFTSLMHLHVHGSAVLRQLAIDEDTKPRLLHGMKDWDFKGVPALLLDMVRPLAHVAV
jgi:hypothetical protein